MTNISTPISIRELPRDALTRIFPLVQLHNPATNPERLERQLAAMIADGYRAAGVFIGEELVGCAGFWLRTRFWCGRQLDIDNVIVHPNHRGRKLGEQLMRWMEEKALAENCELIVLDTYAESHLSHRFYYRLGYVVTGFHFTKVPGSLTPFRKKQ